VNTRIPFPLLLPLFLLVQSCSAQQVRIHFRIHAPSKTPVDAHLYITGNLPAIGNWNPRGMALHHEVNLIWTGSITVPKDFRLEFKITQGSWNQQAIYKPQEIPPNTVVIAERDTTVEIRPLSWSQEIFNRGGGIVGTVRYHRDLRGNGLKYARDIIVWLPPSYNKEKSRRYPVLYMQDGQNIIDPGTSFIGYDWRIDETADSLIRAGRMKEIIVVGIYNSPDRTAEYSNTELGRAYASFVVDRVKPLIDSTYRTLPDRLNTAVMGSSMGAHISFLLAWWYPEIFSQAGCLSAAFYSPRLDDGAETDGMNYTTLREVRSYKGVRKDIRIYLDCGTEGLDARLKPSDDQMRVDLENIGYAQGRELEYFIAENAEHNEHAWAARLWRPLLFMFGKQADH
jgi:enterochelin esterase-like enzyme